MNTLWFKLMILLFSGQVIKYALPNMLFWAAIDVGVFAVGYYLLKQSFIADLQKNLIFFGGLVLINLLLDLRIIPDLLANLAVIGLLVWWFFGNNWTSPFKSKQSTKSRKLRHPWHK